jgi:hypothetical protein
MHCMARILGAPVIEPHGNSARKTSISGVSGRSAETVDTSCHNVGYASATHSASTRTFPGAARRPRSLRKRSTIMMFSAHSFAEASRPSRRRASSCGIGARGAVPFIGRVVTRRPRRAKKSSGDSDNTVAPGSAK